MAVTNDVGSPTVTETFMDIHDYSVMAKNCKLTSSGLGHVNLCHIGAYDNITSDEGSGPQIDP